MKLFYSLYPDTSRLSRYIKPLSEQMSTQKELRELKDLVTMKSKEFEKAEQGVKQALETIELNNQWKINNYLLLVSRLNHLGRSFDSDDDNEEIEGVTEPIAMEDVGSATENPSMT